MQAVWQDLRFGFRMLRRSPGFTAVAVLVIAIGIGANSTIFSFVNGILLNSLPYYQPDRLVDVDEAATKRGVSATGVSFPNYLDWRAQNTVFESIAVYASRNTSITGDGQPERVKSAQISQGVFETLGVSPRLGRTFRAEEDRPNQDLVVILGDDLWRRHFGADPNVLGKTLIVNGRPRTVVGVMPPGFKFPEVAEVWTPMALDTTLWTRNDHGLSAIARLKPGVSLEQAQAQMRAIAAHIEELNPVTNEGLTVLLTDFRETLVGSFRQPLLILLGVVAFVLLIACANVANLLLVRAAGRQREIAIRTALGASRGRIFRQMLIESLLLGAIGGAFGLLVGFFGLRLLLALIPIELPFWMKLKADWRVLGFTLAMSLLTGIVFGAVPAIQSARPDVNETLKDGGRGASLGRGHNRLRGMLVIGEIALSLVLLVGAGLMIKSFMRLESVNTGFNPDHLMAMDLGLPRSRYQDTQSRIFYSQLLQKVQALPGVVSVGMVSALPLSGDHWGRSLTVEGRPVLSVGEAPSINHLVISPNYFRAMGIPILRGRDFTDADMTSPRVTIINETLAHEYWPDGDPIGKRIRFGPPEDNEPWHIIVGVVGDVRYKSMDKTAERGVYLPHAEITQNNMSIVVRTAIRPEDLAPAMRAQVRQMDPDLPVTGLRSMSDVMARSVWQPRLYTILFGVFAIVALVLAVVGIYGVLSYSVSQRTHEIGIRLALGAQTRDIIKLVLGQGLFLIAVGLGIGWFGALGLTRLLSNLLFGVSATDAPTFIVFSIALGGVALLASYIPARRVMKVDPMIALHHE